MAEVVRPEPIERRAHHAAEALAWVSHPIREQREKTVVFLGVVSLTVAAVYLNTGSVLWAAVALGLLALGVYDFWLPTQFRIDAQGVSRRTLLFERRKSWREVRSLHPDSRGVLVSPFPTRSRLDTFRGIYLRFAGNRDAIMAALHEMTGATR